MSIHTFEFVHGFIFEQRFHQALHSRVMLQHYVRWSSDQRCTIIKIYLINSAIFLGKKWCLSFNGLLAMLIAHAVPLQRYG